ncbi:glycosyltransferase family 2 protein [Patescibacteria group bacterium]|nr:glycosyltransferase family 2 protein [Patescibacteria group bacterium]
MKISCIIPTCDRPDFLPITIRSILKQTLKPDEILIINNGKGEVTLPDDLAEKVTVYNIIPYAGVAQARNFGACLAKGEYLAFLDDDDLWNDNYLKNVAKAIDLGAECIISRLDQMVDKEILPFKNAHGKVSIDYILVLNPGITGTNIVISKDAFFKLGGYDPKLPPSEDKTLILEALRNNMKIMTLPNNQAIIRVHNNERLTDSAKIAEGIFHFTRKYSDLMNKRQLLTNWFKIYQYRYDSGKKSAFVPFVFLYVIFRLVKIMYNFKKNKTK